MPEAIIAFLESEDLESAIRLAISIGGDSDTIAAIAGSIAEAFYGDVPNKLLGPARIYLPIELDQVRLKFFEVLKAREELN